MLFFSTCVTKQLLDFNTFVFYLPICDKYEYTHRRYSIRYKIIIEYIVL